MSDHNEGISDITGVDTLRLIVLLPLSIIVWIILSFCQKRTKSFRGVLYDRPGVVHPINFLSPKHRFVYALVLASQGSLWLSLVVESITGVSPHTNKWVSGFVSAIVLVFVVLVQVLMTYPMLACVEAPIPIVGYALGLLYSIVYFVVYLAIFGSKIHDTMSINDESPLKSIKSVLNVYYVFAMGPQLICVAMVIVWYAYKLIRKCWWLVQADNWRKVIFQQFPSKNNETYVRNLFKYPQYNISSLTMRSLYNRVQLPLPVLLATGISIIIIIQLTVVFSVLFIPSIDLIFTQQGSDNASKTIKELGVFLKALVVIPSIFASGMIIVLFGQLLFAIRREILLIRRGQSEFCEQIRDVSSPIALKLTSYVQFTGTQVAALVTGWVFYYVVFLLLIGFLGMIHYLPNVFGYILYVIFIATVISLSIWLIEALMCNFLFLTRESSTASTIILDNRRVFNFFTYTILLYNMAAGLYTNTIRVLKGFGLTLVVMPRLDRLLYVKPFHRLDSGYSAYRNFMITEGLITNPVMHTFVDILLSLNEKRDFKYQSYTQQIKPGNYRFSLKAKNRWLKAYTLMKNPSLQQSIHSQLMRSNGKKANSSSETGKTTVTTMYKSLYRSIIW